MSKLAGNAAERSSGAPRGDVREDLTVQIARRGVAPVAVYEQSKAAQIALGDDLSDSVIDRRRRPIVSTNPADRLLE